MSQPVAKTRERYLANELAAGALLVHPTEGVYGIGCDAWNEWALRRLIAAKGRAADKGLIVLVAAIHHLAGLVVPQDAARVPAPDDIPTTWIVRACSSAPPLVTGGRSTVAVRICGHVRMMALLNEFGGAMVSSSANRAGAAPARTALQARVRFAGAVDAVMGGSTSGYGRPSRIIELATGRVLRW